MAPSLQFIIQNLHEIDYASLVVITCIVYDYILTFPREIDYIWKRPWTLVSTLFVLVRYVGLCGFITFALWGSLFVPGPAKGYFQGWILGVVYLGGTFVFACAADAVMILRVWAMYNRSKLILGILLVFYVGEVVPSAIVSVVDGIPKYMLVTAEHVLDLSSCVVVSSTVSWNFISSMTQLINAGVICILVIIQFIHQSLQMYKVTKQWRLNQLINLLVLQGFFYFLCMFAWNLMNALAAVGKLPIGGWQIVPLFLVMGIPLPTLTPRLILDLRELYARNIYGGGSGIDSGFGLSGLSVLDTSRSAVMFADAGLNGGLEHDEEIPMNVRRV